MEAQRGQGLTRAASREEGPGEVRPSEKAVLNLVPPTGQSAVKGTRTNAGPLTRGLETGGSVVPYVAVTPFDGAEEGPVPMELVAAIRNV